MEDDYMRKLKLPKNHTGISKTLRLPEDVVSKIQILSDNKNISFNKVVIEFLNFALENLDEEELKLIKEFEHKEELTFM